MHEFYLQALKILQKKHKHEFCTCTIALANKAFYAVPWSRDLWIGPQWPLIQLIPWAHRYTVHKTEMHLELQKIQLLQQNTLYCLSNIHNKPRLPPPRGTLWNYGFVPHFLGPAGPNQFIKNMWLQLGQSATSAYNEEKPSCEDRSSSKFGTWGTKPQ